MGYRLNRKELLIIERTKDSAREDGCGSTGKVSTKDKIRPYLYFAAVFLVIAFAVSMLLYFTA